MHFLGNIPFTARDTAVQSSEVVFTLAPRLINPGKLNY